ncbi:MAG: beta-L-arabinofuranosidase domain-containing protein [Candidatus Latescibacterota bacterium]
MKTAPVLTRPASARFDLGGATAGYLKAVTEQWLLPTPAANPAILEIFRDRDRQPARNMVPWVGEFAGKYLTSGVQILRLTGNAGLRRQLAAFVVDLVSLQDDDGYLGPWPRDNRLTGKAPNCTGGSTWDAWGHYHVMLGLLLWHEDTGDKEALNCAARIGDLLCDTFLGQRRRGRRLVDTGSTEMNLAPVHALALLYRRTKLERYLELTRQIVAEFAATARDGSPLAGDYVNTGVAGQPFHETPKPRWESLHPVMGMLELYRLTGDEDCRTAFEHIWWSIMKWDRHNNGGFSSGEKAQGNPYHPGAIETCCTVAWMATSVEMLRLTGDPLVADELELSTLNSGLGLHSHSGRWVTYNTPMDGVRKASAHEIVFQAREGSSELNCCSVNGPRALGMISDWALMTGKDGLTVNWYGPGTMQARVAGTTIVVAQDTDYPVEPSVVLRVTPKRAAEFTLRLRIPGWSDRTRVRVNGETVAGVKAGSYLSIRRRWKRGDHVEVRFDFRLHRWVGERECRGLTSLYRGPLLLTYDRRFNDCDPDDIPVLDLKDLQLRRMEWKGPTPAPELLVRCVGPRGLEVRLCDFASAGEGGSPYRTWLRVRNAGRARPFTRANPLRTQR